MNANNPNLLKGAWDAGIRHFDTAWFYQNGNNERMVDSVLRELNVKREDVTIATAIPGFTTYQQLEEDLAVAYDLTYTKVEMSNSRIPDLRNTLYWNPSVKPDDKDKAGIEFWTSDIASDYEINIQGITSEGKTFSIKKTIKVE